MLLNSKKWTAYHRTNRKVLNKKATADGEERPHRGGSTAVTMRLLNGETLVVTNVGNSRAIVCETGSARQRFVGGKPYPLGSFTI